MRVRGRLGRRRVTNEGQQGDTPHFVIIPYGVSYIVLLHKTDRTHMHNLIISSPLVQSIFFVRRVEQNIVKRRDKTMLTPTLPVLLALLKVVASQSSASSFSATPVSTSVPAPTAALNSSVIGQGLYPPLQGVFFLFSTSLRTGTDQRRIESMVQWGNE